MWRVVRGVITTLLFVCLLLILASSISPIYDFAPPAPFSGADIYNPYGTLDSTMSWRRVSLHTHTRVDGIFNECDYWPEDILSRYEDLGYDVVGISNHNEITPYPASQQCRVPIYEHGFNLRGFHKHVIGAREVMAFDALVPLFTSQLQLQLNTLATQCEVLQLNHPTRTPILTPSRLQQLSNYRIMELTGARDYLENEDWDHALTAGRYCFGIMGDDLHYPDKSHCIATRCSYMAMSEVSDVALLDVLKSGCYYSVSVPDYGDGDAEVKRERNMSLPMVRSVGLKGDTIYMTLTAPAETLRVIGAGHTLLGRVADSDSIGYRMREDDAYARIVVSYPDSLIIMSNPFARYDATKQSSPFDVTFYQVNTLCTVLYNLALLFVVAVVVMLYIKLIGRWRRVD